MWMNVAVKRTHVAAVAAGALVLVFLWAVHPAAKIGGPPSAPRRAVTLPAEAPAAGAEPRPSVSPSIPGAATPSEKPAERTPLAAASTPAMPKVGPPGGRWDHMRFLDAVHAGQGEAGRQEAIRLTATRLSIDAGRISEFEEAARQSVLEMQQALELRERELATLPPAQVASSQSEPERQSEERYAAARAKALERLEKFLAQNTAHQEFRWEFDSWASLVAKKAR